MSDDRVTMSDDISTQFLLDLIYAKSPDDMSPADKVKFRAVVDAYLGGTQTMVALSVPESHKGGSGVGVLRANASNAYNALGGALQAMRKTIPRDRDFVELPAMDAAVAAYDRAMVLVQGVRAAYFEFRRSVTQGHVG